MTVNASAPIRVLIADDQAMVRGALAALLSLEPDIEVVAEVGSGRAAFERAADVKPAVCVLDIEMADGDGIWATEQLRSEPDPPVVLIVTTFGRPGYLKRALVAGAAGFVVKDTPARQLADAIRRVHAGERVVDSALATQSLWGGESALTDREREVLRHALEGRTAADIARRMQLSRGTVRNYLSAAISKTGTASGYEAARYAHEQGWL